MRRSWQGSLLPHRSPAAFALLCTLRKPQLPREKLLHGEGKAGSTQPQGALEDPLRAVGRLHICTPGSLQPSVAMAVTNLFWPMIRQNLMSGRGVKKKQRTGSALDS